MREGSPRYRRAFESLLLRCRVGRVPLLYFGYPGVDLVAFATIGVTRELSLGIHKPADHHVCPAWPLPSS